MTEGEKQDDSRVMGDPYDVIGQIMEAHAVRTGQMKKVSIDYLLGRRDEKEDIFISRRRGTILRDGLFYDQLMAQCDKNIRKAERKEGISKEEREKEIKSLGKDKERIKTLKSDANSILEEKINTINIITRSSQKQGNWLIDKILALIGGDINEEKENRGMGRVTEGLSRIFGRKDRKEED